MSKIRTEVTFVEKNGMNYSRRTEIYENGQVASEGVFSKSHNDWSWSVPHGSVRRYYEDGTLKSEELYDDRGIRNGISTYFNKKGELIKRLQYQDDRLVKEEEFKIIDIK